MGSEYLLTPQALACHTRGKAFSSVAGAPGLMETCSWVTIGSVPGRGSQQASSPSQRVDRARRRLVGEKLPWDVWMMDVLKIMASPALVSKAMNS